MNRTQVDLISDTATRPSPGMRKAMAEAEVGDEQRREDPTVLRLEEAIAALVGQPEAVFLPSASMANQIAIGVHTRPGDEVILDTWSHPANFEGGGAAALSGVNLRLVDGNLGIFTASQVEQNIRADDPHYSRTRLISVEQSTNVRGGCVWPMEAITSMVACARRHQLLAHLDGARLFNAAVASGTPAASYGQVFDSVTVCFSKGLGAPVGAAVAGSHEFCYLARRRKHLFGGAMRQAGILAAGCLYSLEHNIGRLAEDHARAQVLAAGLREIPGIVLDPSRVETNMVYFRVEGLGTTPQAFQQEAGRRGVRFGIYPGGRLRAVTHLDISDQDISMALAVVREVACAGAGKGAQ